MMPSFIPEKLKQQLDAWPRPGCYWIALSGGADSTALLFAMATIRSDLDAEVRAVHINHGLHPDADSWQALCEQHCLQLEIPLLRHTVQVEQVARKSPEAQAREARYSAMTSAMQHDDMLLTAHHADDQAETLILNLMRGAGIEGLAAIQPLRRIDPVWLGRPLLHWRRAHLCEFLNNGDIRFVDDPSNEDRNIRRNFVRHQILPELAEVWPAAVEQLAKSAEHARVAASILNSVADTDLAYCRGAHSYELNLEQLDEFDIDRQALIVRQWTRDNDLPAADQSQLNELLRQLKEARQESALCLKWPGVELHRYRSKLFVMAALPEGEEDWQLPWDGRNPITLPAGTGTLSMRGAEGIRFENTPFQVHARNGSENLRPTGQAHHRSLKQLFQTAGIPPWLRSRVPLLSRDGQCLAVGDLWLDQAFADMLRESGLDMQWQPGLQQWRDVRKHILAIE